MSPLLRVESAEDLGPQFVNNPDGMVGLDGAYSIPLRYGGALWYFGDTLIGRRTAGESLWYPGGVQIAAYDMSGHHGIDLLRTNTGAMVPAQDASRGIRQWSHIIDGDGDIRQLVPHLESENRDEYRVWCLHGIQVDGVIHLYYMVVHMLDSGPMPVNFEIVGCGLAQGAPSGWSFLRIPARDGILWWPASQPQFGSAVIDGRDGFLYVYGVRRDDAGVQRACVARVRPQSLTDHGAYEYLEHGSAKWSPRVEDAIAVMTGMPNEMSVSWNAHLGCWLAVHSLDLSGAIVGRTAPKPWGPWSEPVTLWQVTPPSRDYPVPYGSLIYAGKEHPELSPDGRTLFLTYVEFEEYFPHLVMIRLE